MHRRAPAYLIVLACAAGLVHAPAALAHASLLGSSPAAGADLPAEPAEVVFRFNENVGGTTGAVRVFDAAGAQVDDLDVSHPGGRGSSIGVGLKPGLPEGTYTATYRVVSADTHVVFGGVVFSIGRPGAAPRQTVAGLIARDSAGPMTSAAAGVVRGVNYVSIALLLGGLTFMLVSWLPAQASLADEDPCWTDARRAFERRLARVLTLAVVLGVSASVLGVLLQGASAAGVSLWRSLHARLIEATMESRFGVVWGIRALDWLALALALLALARLPRGARRRRTVLVGAIGLGCIYMALTPALAGHASVESPVALMLAADVVHVLSASVWVGGIACLLFVLPAATRRLAPERRGALLHAALARFSPVALVCVAALAGTGVVQAYVDVRSLHSLLHTTYGLLLVAKTLLLVALICLGAVNRQRVLPALARIARAAAAPGAAGRTARGTLRAELALALVVFGVTAALIAHAPPIDASAGPFSATTTLGGAELELTVEPATVGPNTIHVYLIDAKSGTPFLATKELTLSASLPSKAIGPLRLKTFPAGPGHYAIDGAVLSPSGSWRIAITDRVSEFDSYSRTIAVPIR
jgi:copper transport protein